MNVSALVRKMGPLIGLIVLFVVISALNSSFIDPSNLKNLLRQVSIKPLSSVQAASTFPSAVRGLFPVQLWQV